MLTIYKYPVELSEFFIIDMPDGAEVMSAQMQDGKPVMWVKVDTRHDNVPYKFGLYGTSHPIWDQVADAPFIDTLQFTASGSLVFHLFGGIRVDA